VLIRSGTVTALYLFDIADEIDLAAVPRLLGTAAAPARLVRSHPRAGAGAGVHGDHEISLRRCGLRCCS